MANLLVLVLFASFALSESVDVSIDCGASANYTDENSIVWMGDDDLIQNGEAKVMQSGDQVMRTLRVFSTRKKNCYTIPANNGEKVLVRASFYYGNYDNKSAPPTFDLHFDGNYWGTVKTSSDIPYFYEVIYVVKLGGISVCVAQTKPNQLPFMSALEVRSLDSSMYSHVGAEYALFYGTRTYYDANITIRYTKDAYNRIWLPSAVGNGLNVVRIGADIDVNIPDNPPQAVVQNAIILSNTSYRAIDLGFHIPSETVIYFNMYFSEVSQLDTTQKRSFQIYLNDKVISESIVPPYGSVTEFTNMTTSSSNASLFLVATNDSTLSPLINAMEVFYVSDPLTDGANSKDVEVLALLQSVFNVLKEWSGDPCLPYSYTWDWVNCSTDATPRVTALYLSGFDLSGPLPDLSSMDALEIIDLSNNSFNGPIPDFLGTLPHLKQLNLADNEFSGSVPASLSKNKNLKLDLSSNPDLCFSNNSCQTSKGTSSGPTASGSSKKMSMTLPVILVASSPTFLACWALL